MVTTRPSPPGQPDPDDDPTGVRALLASLPDPGPMPADLVSRITASIAAEHAAARTVLPLRRPRRPLWRTGGIAAAAAVVLGLGGASLLGSTSPGDLGALFGGGADSGAAGAATAARDSLGERAQGGGGSESWPGRSAGSAGNGPVSVHHSATAYTSRHFAGQAARLLLSPGEPLLPTGPESPAIGPIGTEAGLRSCLSALGADPLADVTADLGTFDGTPAAVLVITTGSASTAYAVRRTCTTGRPAVLAGPTTLR